MSFCPVYDLHSSQYRLWEGTSVSLQPKMPCKDLEENSLLLYGQFETQVL